MSEELLVFTKHRFDVEPFLALLVLLIAEYPWT